MHLLVATMPEGPSMRVHLNPESQLDSANYAHARLPFGNEQLIRDSLQIPAERHVSAGDRVAVAQTCIALRPRAIKLS